VAPLALLPLAYFLTYLVNGEINRWALKVHALEISFRENLALTLSTAAVNYFLPFKGALALRALYLKTRHGLTLADFLSQAALVTVATLSLSSLFALLGLLFWGGGEEKARLALGLYFFLILAAGVASLAVGRLPLRLPGQMAAVLASWDRYRKNPRWLASVIFADALYYSLWCFANWLSLDAIGVRLSLSATLFYGAGQIHALLINLTPAGLGVMESFSVFAGKLLDFAPAEALLAQAVNRLSAVAILVVTGLMGWAYLTFFLKKKA
jgi:uncharacterized membrane protein YbhN (UPF0104 family)